MCVWAFSTVLRRLLLLWFTIEYTWNNSKHVQALTHAREDARYSRSAEMGESDRSCCKGMGILVEERAMHVPVQQRDLEAGADTPEMTSGSF